MTQQAEAVDKVRSSPVSDIRITVDEAKKLFLHVNNGKSLGPDGIGCKVLWSCADLLASPFQRLFQRSLYLYPKTVGPKRPQYL